MSFGAVAKAVETPLSGSLKLVFILMANYADENDRCYPSQATLARQAGLSEKTIQRTIEKLEELGFVETLRKGSGNKSSLYRLVFEGGQNVTPDNLSGSQNDHPNQSNCPLRVVKLSTQGGQNVHRSYQDTINDPINKPSARERKKSPLVVDPETAVLPAYVDRNVWIEYCRMRKAKRAEIKTEKTLKLCLSDLEKHSGGDPQIAIAVLEQSISKTWTGLFALNSKPTSKGYWAEGRTITVKG